MASRPIPSVIASVKAVADVSLNRPLSVKFTAKETRNTDNGRRALFRVRFLNTRMMIGYFSFYLTIIAGLVNLAEMLRRRK